MRARVRIDQPEIGIAAGGGIWVNGHQATGVVGYQLQGRVGEEPVLRLDLKVVGPDATADAEVQVSDATRATLLLLGWTPPGEPLPVRTSPGVRWPASDDGQQFTVRGAQVELLDMPAMSSGAGSATGRAVSSQPSPTVED